MTAQTDPTAAAPSLTHDDLESPRALVLMLHGGGQIFFDLNDVNAKRIAYWISRPMPQGQDEFSIAGNSMLDPATGACLDQ